MFTNLFMQWQYPETIVLTPNQRQARYIHEQFDEHQRHKGKKLWPTLAIYPYTTWLRMLWQQSEPSSQLLSAVQWKYLWENIITATDPNLMGLVPQAMQAWSLCQSYTIDIQDSSFNSNEDNLTWQRWALAVQQQLFTNHWLDESLLSRELMLRSKRNSFPKQLYLLNFIELTPLQQQFLQWLTTQGVNIVNQHMKHEHQEVNKLAMPDPQQELSNMVKWAISAAEEKNVACVVPDLATRRDQIDYLFKAYLDDTSIYTISFGKALYDYFYIKQAIQSLIVSDEVLSPLAWANTFQEQLKSQGWPTKRQLNSQEFQLIKSWHELLENFAALTMVQPQCSFSQARARLIDLAKSTMYQPQAATKTRIHVLGILEAAGLMFDAVWVCHMQDNIWPPINISNPFLPRVLQRKCGMPNANAKQQLQFCQRITEQLQHAAPKVFFSYAQHDGENILRESALIRAFSPQSLAITQRLTKAEQLLGKASLETLNDDAGPTVIVESLLHRGSQIFKDQAACPFRAHAKHRLGANGLPLPQVGFRALQRGHIIHAVLEKTWQVLQSHEQLCKFSDNHLNELLSEVIDGVLHDYKTAIDPLFIQLEKQRLLSLLNKWLQQEKQRESFVVIATEEKTEVIFAGLPLNLRIDRIDKLANDQYLILDYKTSVCSTNDWFGDRFDEPQLPLYYIVSALPITSIAFAQIRANEMKIKKLDKLAEFKKIWEEQLQALATEFMQGHATVQPKYGEQTCRYCDLSVLCRVKDL
jgi:hypothetical protein